MVSIPEYGWHDAGATCAHAYLLPGIKRALRAGLSKRPHEEKVRLFDAGCGNGFLAGQCQLAGFEVAGCDASSQGIQQARVRYPDCHFEQMSVDEDMARHFGNDWDVVISTEVIEHLYSPSLFVSNVRQLLKPGGLFIVTTPYHGYVKNLVLALSGRLDHHFTALWDGGHIKFWSRNTLARLLSEAGFSNIMFFGAGRVPLLWKSMIVAATRAE